MESFPENKDTHNGVFTKLTDKPLFGYIQPWNGYVPECTRKGGCDNFPAQTSNIKSTDLYDGMEIECDKWSKMA